MRGDTGRVRVNAQSPIEQTRLRMGTRQLLSGGDVKLSNRRLGLGQSLDSNMPMYEQSGQPVVPGPGSINNTNVTYEQYVQRKMQQLAPMIEDPQQRMQLIASKWNILQRNIRV